MILRSTNSALSLTLILGLASTLQAETLDETREAVRQADITMNRSVAERDTELFASLIAPDAVFLGSGHTEGRQAIIEAWSGFFAADRTVTLSWTPHTVELAASGLRPVASPLLEEEGDI